MTKAKCVYCKDPIYHFQSVKNTPKGLMHSGCAELEKDANLKEDDETNTKETENDTCKT